MACSFPPKSSLQLATPVMFQSPTTVAASSRFQAIFSAALKSYEKRTKKDLITHSLTSQLQACDSTTAILSVLQDKVQEFDKSQGGDERLTAWLGPTVNVLCAFSAAVSGGVALVSLHVSPDPSSYTYFVGIFPREHHLCRHQRLPFGKCLIYLFWRIVLTLKVS